jgi:hypothetical protein
VGVPGLSEYRKRQLVPDFFEVELAFATRCLAERNDADFFGIFGVDDVDREMVKQAERDVTALAVTESRVFESRCLACENRNGIGKVELVLGQV